MTKMISQDNNKKEAFSKIEKAFYKFYSHSIVAGGLEVIS